MEKVWCGPVRGVFGSSCFVLTVAVLLVGSGCGRSKEDDVVITESPETDFSVSPGEPVIAASKSLRSPNKASPRPSPTLSSAGREPVHPVPKDATVPFLVGLPILTTEAGEFRPRVQIELTATIDGKPQRMVDLTNGDGSGVSGAFRTLKPGRYLMKATAPSAPDYPLVARPVEVNGRDVETLAFGAVTFRIPKERAFEVGQSLELSIIEEPSKRPVFKGLIRQAVVQGVDGESHPLMMSLPFGAYSYHLVDVSKDPTIGFLNQPKGARVELHENTFQLTAEKPSALVNLEGIIRVK